MAEPRKCPMLMASLGTDTVASDCIGADCAWHVAGRDLAPGGCAVQAGAWASLKLWDSAQAEVEAPYGMKVLPV